MICKFKTFSIGAQSYEIKLRNIALFFLARFAMKQVQMEKIWLRYT